MKTLITKNLTIVVFAFFVVFPAYLSEAELISIDGKVTKETSTSSPTSPASTEDTKTFKYTGAMVEKNMKAIHAAIIKGKSDPYAVSAMQFFGFAKSYDYFANYSDIEKITGTSRDWFFKVKKALLDMYTPREMMVTAEGNNDKEKYEKSKVEYEEALARYIKLYENPVKVKNKKK